MNFRLSLVLASILWMVWGTPVAAAPDSEADGVPNSDDNCIFSLNSTQADADLDGIGNPCDGDLNQDRFVGGPDFSLFTGCFSQPAVGSCAAADFDGSGVVDEADFPIFAAGFNARPGPGAGAEVHGHVSSRFGDKETRGIGAFRLPDVTVYLEDLITGRRSREAVTDAHGYFAVPKETRGTYHLCMEAPGFISTCDPEPIHLTHQDYVRPADFLIAPKSRALYGRVIQADPRSGSKRPCFRDSVGFGVRDHPRVTLMTLENETLRSVRVNNRGQYLIPSLPGRGSFRVSTTCGDARDELVIKAQGASPLQEQNFGFLNASPRIRSIVARLDGKAVRSAAPGDTLEVTVLATDPDGDSLHYRWGGASPDFESVDAQVIKWNLGDVPARETVYVQVFDSKGGFATQRLSVVTETSDTHFSGIVVDADSDVPLSGVRVSVNSDSVTTGANGDFSIQSAESNRYVLNSEKFSYVFQSHVLHAPTASFEIRMRRVPVQSVDPTRTAFFQTEREKDVLGGSLRIPPNCLVDKSGAVPAGNLNASFYTYDPAADNGIPGDYSAIDIGGNDVRLESYGTWGIDIWDAASQTYNLKPGCEAEFALEVGGPQQSSAPPEIPLLEYDSRRGYWIEAAPPAKFVAGEYRGRVPAFSQWNTDVEFGESACIEIQVDEDRTSYPFKIRVAIPTTSGVDKIKEFPVTERYNGLFRLPPNEAITIEMLPNSGPPVVLKTILADSGDPIAEPFPDLPYDDCKGVDTATGESPVVLALDLPDQNSVYLSRKGGFCENLPDDKLAAECQAKEALEYYRNIGMFDEETPKDTLTAWLTANGFPADEVSAVYYNNLDLKFGRQMHCRNTTGGGLACYVTNFGDAGGPAQLALVEATDDVNPVATVAMEFDPAIPEGEPNRIKFYVYGPDGLYALRAELDSQGFKPVPQICLVCHGGNYDAVDNDVIGGAFREFDFFGFKCLGEDFECTDEELQDSFQQLNAMVKATAPNSDNPHDPIVDLIDGLYDPNVDAIDAVAVDTYVPLVALDPPEDGFLGWEEGDEAALYNSVVKKYCRACHIAQSDYVDFFDHSAFSVFKPPIDSAVCTNLDMPHAEAAFANFWFSMDPSAPHFLADGTTGLGFDDPTCPKP